MRFSQPRASHGPSKLFSPIWSIPSVHGSDWHPSSLSLLIFICPRILSCPEFDLPFPPGMWFLPDLPSWIYNYLLELISETVFCPQEMVCLVFGETVNQNTTDTSQTGAVSFCEIPTADLNPRESVSGRQVTHILPTDWQFFDLRIKAILSRDFWSRVFPLENRQLFSRRSILCAIGETLCSWTISSLLCHESITICDESSLGCL